MYGQSRHYLYSTNGALLAETRRNSWSSTSQMQVYVYLGGEVVGIVDDRQNFYALYNDHLGRPYEAYRLSDNKLGWSAENSAFGLVFEHHNPAAPLLGVQIGLPGQYLDQISGLWYNWHRHYDQALGRYVQSDPIGLGGGINTYAYVGGDPLNFVDPFGLEPCGCSKYSARLQYASGINNNFARNRDHLGGNHSAITVYRGVTNYSDPYAIDLGGGGAFNEPSRESFGGAEIGRAHV